MDKPIHVSLVVTPEVDASALAGLHGVFNAFAQMAPGSVCFSTDIVLPDSAHARTRVAGTIIDNLMGIAMPVQKLVTQVAQTDVLIIPSLYLLDDQWPRNPYPELTEWILAMHSDGQAPYKIFLEDTDHDHGVVLSAQRWLREHSAEPAPVERVLNTANLHARTFNRRFRRATGYTPIRYVQHLRIENAKQQMETTERPVDEISWDVGYEDPAFFRRLFKRLTGMAPRAYRRKFRGIAINY